MKLTACVLMYIPYAFAFDNIGKAYPSLVGYIKLTPKPLTLRCLAVRPRPLKEERKKYFIDIDGTICKTYKNDYYISRPICDVIQYFNKLYEEGNEIHYWTSRGSTTGKVWDKLTVQQLRTWKCKYDSINIGKPHYDYWVDNKAIHVKDLPIL